MKRIIVCSLGHLGLARSLRFGKKTSMMLSVRFVEMIIYLLLEDNFIITIPIGKEKYVDTVIQTVRMYRIDFNMPLDPILYINSVNIYGWFIRCECVKLLRCKLSVYFEVHCDLPAQFWPGTLLFLTCCCCNI